MNTNIYFYKKEYHENERTWYLSGHYSNSIKNKSGSFFAKVRRPIKPNPQKRADYILDLLEIK